jgi:2',3'-cyclic-nucleotide 2'-phosphodiesterase (5'-nucleotidase family)
VEELKVEIVRSLVPAVLTLLVSFPAAAEPPGRTVIRVLSTNDLHGAVDGVEMPELAGPSKRLGGLEFLAGLEKKLVAEAPDRTLLLDVGDCFQGALPVNLAEGVPCVTFRNLAGYDASTLGNHEFDYLDCGPDVPGTPPANPRCALEAALAQARQPVVLANVSPAPKGTVPYVVLVKAGVKIGLTGVVTTETPKIANPGGTLGLEFGDPVAAVAAVLPRMRAEGATVIVVLAHLEGGCGLDGPDPKCRIRGELGRLADAFGPGEVDLIVAGHAHAVLATTGHKVPVIETTGQGMNLARAEIEVDAKTGKAVEGGVRILPQAPVCRAEGVPAGTDLSKAAPACAVAGLSPSDPGTKALREQLDAAVAEVCAELVTEAKEDLLNPRRPETPLGDLTADLMREAIPGTDFAVINSGAVRDGLRAGPVSMCDLHRVWPFEDRLVIVTLSGAEVATWLGGLQDRSIAVSGLVLAREKDGKWTAMDGGGKALDPARLYRVATSLYVMRSGRYGDFTKVPPDRVRVADDRTYRDAIKRVMKARGPLTVPAGDRLRIPEGR